MAQRTGKDRAPLLFLKGFLMGASDVIPGISGGTIAFITGIYDPLIEGLKDVGTTLKRIALKAFGKEKTGLRTLLSEIPFGFFIPLVLGIAIAFAIGSRIIPYLLTHYPAQIFSFFVGLILASAYFIFRQIRRRTLGGLVWGAVGLVLGLAVSLAAHAQGGGNPGIVAVFFLGVIAICAMILPGISGSYILLVLGEYAFMLNVVNGLLSGVAVGENALLAASFILGAVVGLLSFSRLLAYLLEHHHALTFSALAGLMLGALAGPAATAWTSISSVGVGAVSFALAVIGVLVVLVIERAARAHQPRMSSS